MPRDRRPYILLPLAAFIAILPLLFHGCSCGHDYDFHVVNWFEAARQLTHGQYPHWAATPAWNAGEPRFVFYPPLSWIIGAVLGLVMPWTLTPIAYTWLALTAAGLALYAAARDLDVPASPALLAAAIYIANPYTLYTAYERTAYAELLAAAWLPLLVAAILRPRPTITRIAIPVALLWLTNAPAAVMGCYTLALLALLRLIFSTSLGAPFMRSHRMSGTSRTSATAPAAHAQPNISRTHLALTASAGTLLGLGLAAFYVLPAAYERRFVQINMAILPGMSFSDNFLFHRTADVEHDTVLHTASIVAVLLIALTAIALMLTAMHRRSTKPGAPSSRRLFAAKVGHRAPARSAPAQLTLPLTLLAATITFLLTPLSTPIWNHLPDLAFLQFPWRLTAVLAAVFALSLAIALSRLNLKPTQTALAALLTAAALTFSAYTAFHQTCYPEDTVPERLAVFLSANPGTDPTDEYTPTTADNDKLAQTNPGHWLTGDANADAPKDAPAAPAPHHLDLNIARPQTLILNLRDYPAWQINRNGSPIATRLHRDDGLIAILLPAGPSHIDITWTSLPDQRLGDLFSALAAIALAAVLLRSKRPKKHRV